MIKLTPSETRVFQLIPRGMDNARKQKEIFAVSGIAEQRTFRAIIERLRHKGIGIYSTEAGMFKTDDPAEIVAGKKRYTNIMVSIQKNLSAMQQHPNWPSEVALTDEAEPYFSEQLNLLDDH